VAMRMSCAWLFLGAIGAGACNEETSGPVCSGIVTADLGAGATPRCEGAWLHGEQMCPQETRCGVAVTCMAYSSFQLGECTCPALDASHSSCCAVSISAPGDGATVTSADDVDPAVDGIQIDVAVHGESCWLSRGGHLLVHRCGGVLEGPWSSFDAGGNATGVVDLDPAARCTSICADMVAIGVVAASDSVEVCLPTR